MPTSEELRIIAQGLAPSIGLPVTFLLWVGALWTLKEIIIRRLRRLSAATASIWDDVVVEAFSFPANLLILASGLYLVATWRPWSERIHELITLFCQGAVILAVIIFLDKLLRGWLLKASAQGRTGLISHGITQGLIRGFVYAIGALFFLDLIGISITPILASLGIGSLAVALALQDTLANFFAGIFVAIDKPIRVGDFIRLESGEKGVVTDIGWRSTRIRMLPNNTVILSNTKLMSSVVTNYSLPSRELAVLVEVGVHYDSDLSHVERVTTEVAREIMKSVPGGVPEFEPFIRYHTLDSSSINFSVIMRGKEFTDRYLIKHEFIRSLHERYRREKIVIPFPIRTLEISPGAAAALRYKRLGKTDGE